MRKSTRWAWIQSAQRESVRTMANIPTIAQSGPSGENAKRNRNSNSKGQKLFVLDQSEVDGEDVVK